MNFRLFSKKQPSSIISSIHFHIGRHWGVPTSLKEEKTHLSKTFFCLFPQCGTKNNAARKTKKFLFKPQKKKKRCQKLLLNAENVFFLLQNELHENFQSFFASEKETILRKKKLFQQQFFPFDGKASKSSSYTFLIKSSNTKSTNKTYLFSDEENHAREMKQLVRKKVILETKKNLFFLQSEIFFIPLKPQKY